MAEKLSGRIHVTRGFEALSRLKSALAYASKDETYMKVFRSALLLDFKKGHKRWTLSELSRASGVTRSLIYYYFGKSRDSLLLEAVKCIGEEVFGLTDTRMKLWEKGRVLESVQASRQFILDSPYVTPFYFAHRTRESDIGLAIRNLEHAYFAKIRKFFPRGKPFEIEARFAVLLGLVFAPELSPQAAQMVVKLFQAST